MSRKMLVTTSVVFLSGTLALVAAAQQAEQPNPNRTPNQRNTTEDSTQNPTQKAGHDWKNGDHHLATCVATANQAEIALSEYAAQKAQHPEVKKFASMLVKDHREFLQKLEKYAPEATETNFLTQGESREAQTTQAGTRPATTTRPAPTSPSAPAQPNAAAPSKPTQTDGTIQQTAGKDESINQNRVQTADGNRTTNATTGKHYSKMGIEKELAEECLKSAKEKLQSKSGEEFDKCFVGMQIAMHMHMKDKLTVFQRHTSGELAQLLSEGQKTTEEHMAKAEELMKALEQDKSPRNSTGTKRSDEATPNRESKSPSE